MNGKKVPKLTPLPMFLLSPLSPCLLGRPSKGASIFLHSDHVSLGPVKLPASPCSPLSKPFNYLVSSTFTEHSINKDNGLIHIVAKVPRVSSRMAAEAGKKKKETRIFAR